MAPHSDPTHDDEATGEPSLPGIVTPSASLDAALRHALDQKGASYTPRTEHIDGKQPLFVNRLIRETSPYLLQHAHNPVNWSPWSDDAFARAKDAEKPVLLSVGYSTCHWCHVMERESFENIEIATFINQHFVPIKVDREERPDVDEVYMRAVYLLTGHGGWPMTVILTPQREPFFAGTYFPPFDGARGARHGFLTILQALSDAYRKDPDDIAAQARELSQRIASLSAPQAPGAVPSGGAIEHAVAQLEANYDARHGGFGGAPKFPQPARLGLLLRHHRRTGNDNSRAMATTTLLHMANGGIFDHVGGGFHRYSVDREWLVPHFEKMLYDNAQLVVAYLDAAQVTRREEFEVVARRTLDYVLREMTAPGGAFFSATDADSRTPDGEEEEGWFFTWTPAELHTALDDEQKLAVETLHAVTTEGNFEGRNIFHTPRERSAVAEQLGWTTHRLNDLIAEANLKLYQARSKRPPPLRDDKILTAWNGLMISAFARAGLLLDENRYRSAARDAALFVLAHLREPPPRLLRSHLDGRSRHPAVLEDYAFLIRGLLDVYEATGELKFFEAALELQGVQESDFAAPQGGYYMTAHDAEKLLARDKPDHDGATPSGNSVAAENLLRFWAFTGEHRYREGAEQLFEAFSRTLQSGAAPAMLIALEGYHDTMRQVIIIRGSGEQALLQSFRRTYLPNRIFLCLTEEEARTQSGRIPLLEGKVQIEGRATAYVCEQGRCELPTHSPDTFLQQLSVVQPLTAEK